MFRNIFFFVEEKFPKNCIVYIPVPVVKLLDPEFPVGFQLFHPTLPESLCVSWKKKIKIIQIYITRLAPNLFLQFKTFSVCRKTIKKILRFLNIFHRILNFFFMKIEFWRRHFISEILGPIGSAVFTFIGYKQTDRQVKYINRLGKIETPLVCPNCGARVILSKII